MSTEWLATHLDDSSLLLVDATVLSSRRAAGGVHWHSGIDAHRREHIPGAVFADILHAFSEPHAKLHFTRPTVERFQAAARALGARPESTVVVYDAGNGAFAARLWWLFRAYGHHDVAVLDGGLAAWRAAGLPLEPGETDHEQGTLVAVADESLWADKPEVERIVAGAPGTLVSALPPDNPEQDIGFRGRPGRIPGSVTVPAGSLLADDNTLRPEPDLREAFASADTGEPVVVYCGGGISASLDALALTRLGAQHVRVYDGSLNEWALDPEAPLVQSVPPRS